MQSEPHCCVPHQRLLDALEIMGEERMDWVAVVATGASRQWLGWVTAYDAAVFLGSFDKRPSQVMCREVMTSPPALLAPDMDVEQAYTAIRAACVQRLPVIQNGTFTGVVRLP
ncbi:MAG: CBS domain-containing protein [Terriglobales bacterium]